MQKMLKFQLLYRLSEPSSFFLYPVIIHNNEKSDIGEVKSWRGYDVTYDVEITVSNTIKGDVLVTFPERHDEVVTMLVLVIYNVTINGVEYGPFQQFTCETGNIIWREEQLSEEEITNKNGVTIQVCILEFHC